jgi:hypothetical protein
MTCPDDLQLAAFLENRLPRDEHARVLAHVADCAACAEVVAETRRFLEPQGEGAVVPLAPATKPASRHRMRRLRWAVAASVALAAILWTVRFGSVEPIGPAGVAAERLVAAERQVQRPTPMAAAGWNEWTGAFGFSNELSLEQRHFRWGVVTLDVEWHAARSDRDALEALSHELAYWSNPTDQGLIQLMRALQSRDVRGSRNASRQLERRSNNDPNADAALAYRVGRWIEALRLASAMGDQAAVLANAGLRPPAPYGPAFDTPELARALARIDDTLAAAEVDLPALSQRCADLIRLR